MSKESVDLTGVGEVAKAIPDAAWIKLVNTACVTFEKSLAPLTETTTGFGRLISETFDSLSNAQKIIASTLLSRLSEKVKDNNIGPDHRVAKSSVVIESIKLSSNVDSEDFHRMWINLLQREFLEGDVHPSFPNILAQLSSVDAIVLAILGESEKISGELRSAWEWATESSPSSFLNFKQNPEELKEKQRKIDKAKETHELLKDLVKDRNEYLEDTKCDLSFYLLEKLGLIESNNMSEKHGRLDRYDLTIYGRSFYSVVAGI